jgi:glycosyltransferase involved in cell wall biosynthesis
MRDHVPTEDCRQGFDPADDMSLSESNAPTWNCSIVIPCFNQGRFLVDCLESLVCQSVPPLEVVVVDDGSTDGETIALLERLSDYNYPFPLVVLRKPNGGASSARNFGIDRCRGEFILPLDADDKLAPQALAAYRQAFQQQPHVDVFYPDVAPFGNELWVPPAPAFNKWWLTQGNFMVSASAVRRRVFDAGYRYDERMRKGLEDWEFWIRTCALGPFTAAPLKMSVLYYRQWGHSVSSAVDQQQVEALIRFLHTQAGLWSDVVENRLRKEHAPSHCVCNDNSAGLERLNDLRTVSREWMSDFLAEDRTSRFVWFGSFPAQWIAAMQLTVNEISERRPAAAFVFKNAETQQPYCVVIDRFWALLHPSGYRRAVLKSGPVMSIETRGERQLVIQKVVRRGKLEVAEQSLLPFFLQAARNTDLLPSGHDSDPRVAKEIWHFLERRPERPRRVDNSFGERVLVIALASLRHGAAEQATLAMLEKGTIRSRYDRIVLLVFEDGLHPAHSRFEQQADSIVYLGNLGLDHKAKLSLGVDVCRAAGAADFFINNSRHGYDLIPRLRKAKLPTRITAQIHAPGPASRHKFLADGFPRLVAANYANLIDRVASSSGALTRCLIDELYFPPGKIQTVRLATESSPESYTREMLSWLFPQDAPSISASVFGVNAA